MIKVGDTIYHEDRYWTSTPVFDEEPGWNANYLRYTVVKVTASRIYAEGSGPDGKLTGVQFSRAPKHKPGHAKPTTLEADGKQYHSRFHEYFYTEIPKREKRWQPFFRPQTDAAAALGLSGTYTADDVKRAYKRLAREHHPDAGGSHEAFVKLKQTRDAALKGVGTFTADQSVSGLWRCACGATVDFRVSGNLGGVGAELLNLFMARHGTAGHHITKVA